MSYILWKCYRCDLSFRDEAHARMHEEVSGHAPTKLRAVAA